MALKCLGKLVKSNSHTDYVCQIYGPGEIEIPPSPEDYAFGSFVRIPLSHQHGDLIGVIYDTLLLNPDFGNLGPRLSPASDLAVFSPDYLVEKVTLVGITAVGTLRPDGSARHGVPALAGQIDTLVSRLDDAAVQTFHQPPQAARVQMGYTSLLLAQGSAQSRHLLLNIIAQLEGLFPGQTAHLNVLRNELTWQAFVNPLGGRI